MLLFGYFYISLVIKFLLLSSSVPATKPGIPALTPLPNLSTPVTSKLQKLKTHSATHPHYSQATSFTAFINIEPLIHPKLLNYSPSNFPQSKQFLFRCADPLTSVQFHLFTTLSHQTLQWPACRSLDPPKFDAFASITSLVTISTGGTSMAMGQFHGHLKNYLHILYSAHSSM